MDNKEKINYWIELADYDYETAMAMLGTSRFLYVGFMCHQIVEKTLKAYYVKNTNQTPPHSHNLRFLLDLGGLSKEIDEETLLFIIELQPLNIEGRYPTYKEALLKLLTKERCENLINKTKGFLEWIKMKL